MIPTDENFEHYVLHGGISDVLVEEIKTNPNGAFCKITEVGDLYPPSQEELSNFPCRVFSKKGFVDAFKEHGLAVSTIHKPVYGEFICIRRNSPV